ncbi:MAG: type II toxin-antitoxin system VapC family toxin [Gammaproteobacteria bacterium]|nr:type II toxin-antitoxin system VapC family toxin [Gammaproteobacteria bacterium]
MFTIAVNDASCLIDLRKGRLLPKLCHLPFRLIVPLPIRESELTSFTPGDWRILDRGGMKTHNLTPEEIAASLTLRCRFGRLSANDCFCVVTAQFYDDSILLTGDSQLRAIASSEGIRTHGVLWVVEQLWAAKACSRALLIKALEIWKSDRSVFLSSDLIDRQLHDIRQPGVQGSEHEHPSQNIGQSVPDLSNQVAERISETHAG